MQTTEIYLEEKRFYCWTLLLIGKNEKDDESSCRILVSTTTENTIALTVERISLVSIPFILRITIYCKGVVLAN
jgi:hypothetical protein